MATDLEKVKQTWQTLGREDPLWAIASVEGKRGGKWDEGEFLASGDGTVEYFCGILKQQGVMPASFNDVLDFGCGVGRVAWAWAKRATRVTGVDISAPMIERGKALLSQVPNVRLLVNEAEDLRCFETNTFDLVFSHVCLQHIPWPCASGYLREFARVCAPGGWVLFDLPSRRLSVQWGPALRQRLIESLPFGLGRAYRRWRHGSEAIFEMHYTPPETVEATLTAAGLAFLHRQPSPSAGENVESFVYLFGKPAPGSGMR